MATVQTIVTRAMKRGRILDPFETPGANDAADALDALNDMLYALKTEGMDLQLQAGFALSDTLQFWVPPENLNAGALADLAFQGAWNATTNSPALASGTGTKGHYYRVSVAGSTALDDVSSWAVNDYAVYDGDEWLKGRSSRAYEAGLVAMLAVRMAEDFGAAVGPVLARDAKLGWEALAAAFAIIPTPTDTYRFEGGLTDTAGALAYRGGVTQGG